MRKLLTALALCLVAGGAFAQSNPNLTRGQVPTAAQWNSFFSAKQDVLGFNPLSIAGGALTGELITVAPTAVTAGFNLPHGTAPTSPVNGDLWTTTGGIFAQINGSTVGPLGTGGGGGGGSGTVTSVGYTAGAGIALSGTASPITTTGSFGIGLAPITNGTVLGNTSGISAAPSALSPTQLTTLINPATASLSGALPAWPNNTTTFFRGDGSYQTLNCAALSGAGAICPLGIGAGLQSTGGNLAIGTNVATLNTADQTVTGGAIVTALAQSTGNITIDCGARPIQSITNNGAWTITAPANDGSCLLLVTNGASAGATSFSGFSVGVNTGDTLTTTNTSKFTIFIWRAGGTSGYRVAAHQ